MTAKETSASMYEIIYIYMAALTQAVVGAMDASDDEICCRGHEAFKCYY